ncbi:hypothetical protein [Pseudomonas bohemica]|uniref:hypothetical protein n=1 Tax=Pseudomonas bohemica TaxID=2044872 RepID=UPI000DA62332|nr:hypothetical protein [Pseudomonas bohemica]
MNTIGGQITAIVLFGDHLRDQGLHVATQLRRIVLSEQARVGFNAAQTMSEGVVEVEENRLSVHVVAAYG